MNIRKWLHIKHAGEPASSHNPSAIRTTFLDLPGELRNQIYAYSIYPDLTSITVANCTKPEHFAASLLHHPFFRTSRQIRAEALSYLCANFTLKFCSLRCAVLLFSCAGNASSEIKSLVLMQPVLSGFEDERSREIEDKFFSALERMKELSEVSLSVFGTSKDLRQCGEHAGFIERLEKLRERKVAVRIHLGKRRWF